MPSGFPVLEYPGLYSAATVESRRGASPAPIQYADAGVVAEATSNDRAPTASVVSRAAPKARVAQRRPRRSVLSRLPGFRMVSKFLYGLGFLVLCCSLAGSQGGTITAIGRLFGATADLSEAVGGTASSLFRAVSNVTVQTETFVVGAAVSARNLLHELWGGVDLLNVTVTHTRGSTIVDDWVVFRSWLLSPAGASTSLLAPEVRDFVLNASSAVGAAMPVLHQQRTFTTICQNYTTALVASNVLDSGYIAISWAHTHVVYEPRWANPIWDLLTWNVETENEAIQQQVLHILSNLPLDNNVVGANDVLATVSVPTLLSAKTKRMFRWSYIFGRHCAGWLFDPIPSWTWFPR